VGGGPVYSGSADKSLVCTEGGGTGTEEAESGMLAVVGGGDGDGVPVAFTPPPRLLLSMLWCRAPDVPGLRDCFSSPSAPAAPATAVITSDDNTPMCGSLTFSGSSVESPSSPLRPPFPPLLPASRLLCSVCVLRWRLRDGTVVRMAAVVAAVTAAATTAAIPSISGGTSCAAWGRRTPLQVEDPAVAGGKAREAGSPLLTRRSGCGCGGRTAG